MKKGTVIVVLCVTCVGLSLAGYSIGWRKGARQMAQHLLNPTFMTVGIPRADPNTCQHDGGLTMRPHPVTLERRVGAIVEVIFDTHCDQCEMLLVKGEDNS